MDQYFSNNAQSIVTSNRILYTPSSFARTSLLHLQEIGELEAKLEHMSSRSNLQSFLFFCVISGEGELVYDGKTYSVFPSSCVFIDCRKPYSHKTSKNLWTLRWVHFFGPTASSIYDKYCERGGRPMFRPETTDEFMSVWTDLMTTAASSDYMRDMLINQHLSTLLTLIMSESWHPEDKVAASKKQSIMEVREYLDLHYNEKVSLEELSNIFYIDKYYLAKIFKDQFGMNISAYIQNLRITKAKQMLRFSGKSVEEISFEVGYSTPSYFSRLFKELEGVSPSVYREQW